MATYIQTINRVLRRLRESEVAAPSTTSYSALIGDFVNEAKREVEEAWKWHALRTQIQVTTAAGTNGYSVTGAGKRFKFVDQLRRAYDATNNNWIHAGNATRVKRELNTNTTQGTPDWYYFEGVDGSGDPKVYFYSIPNGVLTINFDLVVPQADLSTGATEITVPDLPVYLGAYAKALAERGEDNGTTFDAALGHYDLALADAVALDAALATGEDTWWVN